MPCTRLELEARERQMLAPCAQFSADTRGRKYPEEPPEWRTHYQRDRDRVIHARAFRRLEYKTQVFLNGTGDHLRTRLTHSMEVAGIARNISRALRINEDLTETIALAHDLGHSPFGHSGEKVLNELMQDHGGFEHNQQSLRVVEELEQKYPGFPGLNLSWEVREGLVKHYTSFDHPSKRPGFEARSSSLEAQVANLADEITYYSHDLDDGLTSGLLTEPQLRRDIRIWADADRAVRQKHGDLPDEVRRYFIVRCLIDDHVKDVVHTTEEHLRAAGVKSADDVRLHDDALVQYSPERRQMNQELRGYLYEHLYFHPEVHLPNERATAMLAALFHYYMEHQNDLDDQWRQRAQNLGWPRAICDYLAGMTDRYAVQEYQRLIGFKKESPIYTAHT
ncbi:MAG: deoxyguanosinetriphosphate triphosphohydrolase [Verrucomicrobia bacterium]|nr:deoxyguanosinetriphosphate triphosphohydrolase [Verrucomicrobiota bacterium]